MRRVGGNSIELLGTLALVGSRLFILSAIVKGLELFEDEVEGIPSNGSRLEKWKERYGTHDVSKKRIHSNW